MSQQSGNFPFGGATIFVVATPIGNLQDITPRALDALKNADVILCEDTRVTRKLLSFHQIYGKIFVHLKENPNWISQFIQKNKGKKIALLSDTGTPALSDPGAQFISYLLNQKNIPFRLIPIPGASAVTAALSVSGLGRKGFVFLGFLPRSPIKLIKELNLALTLKKAVVFYESPKRILATLALLAQEFPQTLLVLAREMTKIHEEILRGQPQDILKILQARREVLGELTVVVGSDPNSFAIH